MSDAAPSIGSIGKVAYDPRNGRSKGLLTDILGGHGHLRGLLSEIVREHTHGERLNVRTIIGKGVDPNVSGLNWQGFPLSLEVWIPVRGHPRVNGLAYYGANNVRRVPSDAVRSEERRLYMRVLERPPGLLPDVRVDLLAADSVANRDVEDLVAIYQSSYTGYLTDFNPGMVRDMIANNMVLVVRDKDGRVASVCVAEMAQIEFPGTLPLRLVEISDAATRRDCRDQGFYSAAKHHCIEHIRGNGDPVPTVITTEARANSGRVLRSNLRLGMAYAGYQPMHCVISSSNDEDVRQDNRYGNLIVFYVP